MTNYVFHLLHWCLLLPAALAWPNLGGDATYDDSSYEYLTAAEKETILWEKVQETAGTKGSFSPFRLLQMFSKDLSPTVDHYSDFIPYEGGKPFHSVGAVATVKFDTSDNNSTFTGIFAEGSHHGVIRLSLALGIANSKYVPGLALKFLRNGMYSANVMAMESIDGQESGNFFERDFSNHITEAKLFTRKILERKFARTYAPPGMVGLSDIASFTEQGSPVCQDEEPCDIVFPYELILKPNPMLREQFVDAAPSEEGLEELVSAIPAGTKLYDVYARAEPQDTDLIPLGTLETTSEFLYSKFGDNELFFRHQRITDDFALRPEWNTNQRRRGLRTGDNDSDSIKCPMLNRI
mmetsp:Transcript_30912/g.46932  ORF Transcript_30912/g.46932 Transcript_30912/m.46932 type:complete len:351 (-) Transcript_30912:98-1150(-)|eukprot:CAMPEP_0178918788 /NCGR_PEP_ID=MMETSP0786-20121207/14028_1 /TAXON_ID=186022 /ORGANISM="Thalassionema frauenfeldii, Strain CCMP 1798" /LENGTH=350 /DNA_ID=CAMNT_0020592551 /DNA_START=124 /DNA_END=1176 /DNA_ORIENTATION=+